MKAVSLLSGGIDSPVASYLMSRAGADVVLLHMDNSPYCDDRALKNVIAIAEQLEKHTGKRFPLYVAPHGPSQTAIHDACDRNYQCVMCKRAMHRTAGEFARIVGADMIVMGDSLGQVASQTLKNLRAERTDMTVLRFCISGKEKGNRPSIKVCFLIWSGGRESNPQLSLGKAPFYR